MPALVQPKVPSGGFFIPWIFYSLNCFVPWRKVNTDGESGSSRTDSSPGFASLGHAGQDVSPGKTIGVKKCLRPEP